MPAPRMLLLCGLLVLLVPASRQLSITELLVPKGVLEGSSAELQCWFTAGERVDYVKWWWTPRYVPSEDRNRVLIYQRLTGQPAPELPRKKIEWKGNDTIELLDLKSGESGIYECEVSGDAEVRRHENLTVYSNGTDLELNVTRVEDGPDDGEEEDLLVHCEARDVTPLPELSISINGKEVLNTTQQLTEGAEGMFSVQANATVSGEDAEGADIRCELFYQDKEINHPPYVASITYTTGAVRTTTESPESTTHSEVASELQNTNGVVDLHASFWILCAAALIQLYVLV